MAYHSLYRRHALLFIFIAFFISSMALGQVGITGAQCVTTGLTYQYAIKGQWKENDKVRLCVEGGVLVETGASCVDKQRVSVVLIQWIEGKAIGKITLTSGAGTANLTVSIAPVFNPGFVETTDKQTITYNKLPPSLSCTQASGGNCSPSFSYQWEQSQDMLKWVVIPRATGRNLSFDTPLKQTTFFRRRVFDSKSKTIGYSNAITVFVTPDSKKK